MVFMKLNILVICSLSVCIAALKSVHIKVPDECKKKTGLCYIKPEGYDKLQEKMNSLLQTIFFASTVDRDGEVDRFVNDPINCSEHIQKKKVYLDIKENGTYDSILINTDVLHQSVTTVKCVTTEQIPCFNHIDHLLSKSNLKATCVQNMSPIDLFVYVQEIHAIVKKEFYIETGCSCQIDKNE